MIKKYFLNLLLAFVLLPSLVFAQQLTPANNPGSLQSAQLQKRLKMLEKGERLRSLTSQCSYDIIQDKIYQDPRAKAEAEAMEKALQKRIRKIEADKTNGT